MTSRVELRELELSQHRVLSAQSHHALDCSIDDLAPIRTLLRWHGTPLGTVDTPTIDRVLSDAFPYYNGSLYAELIRNSLTQNTPDAHPHRWRIQNALNASLPAAQSDRTITVAYCFSDSASTDRSNRKALIESLLNQTHSHLQILLIEYGIHDLMIDSATLRAFGYYANVEYYAIAQLDLKAAQQVALDKCSGDLMSFVDDRTVFDSGWAAATARLFDRNPSVRLMTGLTLPLDLSAPNQVPYENLYGLACGFTRQWIQWTTPPSTTSPSWIELGVMQYGSPLNLVIHRDLIQGPHQFSWSGMTQTLLQGEILVYEPRSIVRLRLPETPAQIEQAIEEGMRSFYTYLRTSTRRHRALRFQFLTLGLWKLTRVLGAWVKTYGLPRRWFTAELRAIFTTLKSPLKSYLIKASLPKGDLGGSHLNQFLSLKTAEVFTLELSQPIATLYAPDSNSIRLYIKWCDRLLGYVSIDHYGKPVGIDRIVDTLVDQFLPQILAIPFPNHPNFVWQASEQAISQYFAQATKPIAPIAKLVPLPDTVSVSIIIPTCDRPDDLRHCLTHLQQLQTQRPIEIIVADNRPLKGSAAKVLKDFPRVKLIEELRVGSSYARNAAIAASQGDLVVTIDDDVTVPSDWLEKLIAPFNRPEVLSVCGGVLPLVLDTPAQLMFEDLKGGLCFGFERKEVDRAWLDSFQTGMPPIWELGVSANAAFRSTIFADPAVGLMEEALGAGTPAGGAEENHFAYKILRSGGTILYDPSVYVWHHHRRTLRAFYRQVQGQMVSCPALNLTLWLQEGDLRGRQQLLIHMPRYFWQCWRDRILGRSKMPWIILFYEFKGYLIGFWGYWESQRLVKRQGRSDRYISVNHRVNHRSI